MTEELLEQIILIVNPREKVNKERIKYLNGRLKEGYTFEEIIAAAVEFSKSDWHKNNGQMSIDNLIRSSKFGRWFAQIPIESNTQEEINQQHIDQDKRNKEMIEAGI